MYKLSLTIIEIAATYVPIYYLWDFFRTIGSSKQWIFVALAVIMLPITCKVVRAIWRR